VGDPILSDQRFEYYAFISYSHKDEKWAKWLHRRLERYRLPNVIRKQLGETAPKPPYKVFRDVTDLGIGALRENLHKELDDSRFLIVICSPNSAKPNAEGKHWVNDEIKKFIDMGRIDRIVPFIVAGTTYAADPNQECLPPAVKENNILGTNVAVDGKESAFIHVVAKILGLKFDHLYRRHMREERKKKWLRSLAGAVLLVLLGIGVDYERTKTAYYQDYFEYVCLPQGLFPLTGEQVRHRGHSWKFSTHHWKLSSVACVDSYVQLVQPQGAVDRPASEKLYYRDNGSLDRIEECDADGNTVRIRQVSLDDKRVDFKDIAGHPAPMGGMAPIGLTLNSFNLGENSDIVAWEFIYGPGEKSLEVHYMNPMSQPVCDSDNLFGFAYYYLESRQVGTLLVLNSDYDGTEGPGGVGGQDFVYDAKGNLTDITWMDKYGKRHNNLESYVEEKRQYDEYGNMTEADYFGVDQKPALTKGGYAKKSCSYDSRGNQISEATFGLKGEPVLDSTGAARWEAQYDTQGRKIAESYFGLDGKPVLNRLGIAKRVIQYGVNGKPAAEVYLGLQGEPVLGTGGYGGIAWQYRDDGKVSQINFLGTDGKPALNAMGYASVQMHYSNQDGRLIEEDYLGLDGQPALGRLGYGIACCDYDRSGHISELWFCKSLKGLALNPDGWAQAFFQYGNSGNRTEITYKGVDEKPINCKEGWSRAELQYNAEGQLVHTDLFNTRGGKVKSGK